MKRLLISAGNKQCTFNCKYCFSSFSQYEKSFTLDEIETNTSLLKDIDFICPACDIDIFGLDDPISYIERVAKLKKSISISTKALLSEEVVSKLVKISEELEKTNDILKISVSFSCKRKVSFIEPGASDYKLRLNNLKLLSKFGIASSAILKPILVEIPATEYLEIIKDIKKYNQKFILGYEYLDKEKCSVLTHRPLVSVLYNKVNWLPKTPYWPFSDAKSHMNIIKNFIDKNNLKCFDSDIELMEMLLFRQRISKVYPFAYNFLKMSGIS